MQLTQLLAVLLCLIGLAFGCYWLTLFVRFYAMGLRTGAPNPVYVAMYFAWHTVWEHLRGRG